MADLAALRRTDAAGLTVCPRGHVVVVDVALLAVGAERVEHLVHARHREGAHVHDLGLAALEQAGAVRGRQDAHLGRDRTQVLRAPTIDADSLLDDALAHELLREAAHCFLHCLLLAGELAAVTTEFLHGLVTGCIGCRIAVGLQCDGDGVGKLRRGDTLDGREHLVGVVEDGRVRERRDGPLGGDDGGNQLALQRDGFLDPCL